MPLHHVLRIVGALIYLVAIGEYFILDKLMIPPFIAATVLIIMSFLFARWPRVVAGIACAISILAPLAALNRYLQGQLVLFVPIFDAIVFAWLLWIAISVIRGHQEQSPVIE
ncbi:MAG: hypothetical protein AAF512_19080 [Pseudomonadota bacterium]